jgi:hypothetical protein
MTANIIEADGRGWIEPVLECVNQRVGQPIS